jgi:hypothetical protein
MSGDKVQKVRKATNLWLIHPRDSVSPAFLKARFERNAKLGFGKQKWIIFCERLLANGFSLLLYEVRKTASKYITVQKDGRQFKVRFSNHKPIKGRELGGDCDFFVGHTHTGIRTTEDAIEAIDFHFKREIAKAEGGAA